MSDTNGTARDAVNIEVCCDCAAILANGELGGFDPDGRLAEAHAQRMVSVWSGAEILLGDTDDEDYVSFSWSRCDGCGSHEAGERYAATVLVAAWWRHGFVSA